MNTKKLKKETLISAYDRLDKLTTLQFLKLLAKEVDARQLKLSSVNAGKNITITFDEEGNPVINATGELSVEWNNILNKPLLAELDKENTFTKVQKFRHISGISIYGNEDVTDLARLSISRSYFTIVESDGQAHVINIPTRTGTMALREEIDIELTALDGRVESLEDSVSDLDTYKEPKKEKVTLWTNDDPTQPQAQTTATLSESAKNFDEIEVVYNYSKDYPTARLGIKFSLVGNAYGPTLFDEGESGGYVARRINFSDNNLTIYNCYNQLNHNEQQNNYLIIYKINGIRNVTPPAKVKKASADVKEGTK